MQSIWAIKRQLRVFINKKKRSTDKKMKNLSTEKNHKVQRSTQKKSIETIATIDMITETPKIKIESIDRRITRTKEVIDDSGTTNGNKSS
jgi:hypothetical protein